MGRLILVVDDDELNREAIEEILVDEGYDVLTAAHGQEALLRVEERPPDLILLDMYMSVMDGPEFAQAYRQRPGPHAPIIVITGLENAAAKASEIDADDYLGKPFEPKEMLDLLERFLPPA